MPKYAIAITEDNMDLIMFLNDGIRPNTHKDDKTYLVCEINGPREITTKVEFEHELYNKQGHRKDPSLTFLI